MHLLNILYSALCEFFLEKWNSSQIFEDEQKIKFQYCCPVEDAWEKGGVWRLMGEGELGALWPDGPN